MKADDLAKSRRFDEAEAALSSPGRHGSAHFRVDGDEIGVFVGGRTP
jgi:hypothetical protein